MNPDQVKQYIKSHEFKQLAKSALLATVFAKAERKRVDTYLNELLELYDFYPDSDKATRSGRPTERITDHNKIWLSDDEELMTKWYADCDKEHRAHGFTGPEGHCPALVAEELQRIAEEELIKSAAPAHGMSAEDVNRQPDIRKKFTSLLLTAAIAEHNITTADVLPTGRQANG